MSKECSHVVEREEKFFTLSVEIKNKKNITESLELYVEGDMLEGDNKYFCGTCERKVDALKRCCIKELPGSFHLNYSNSEDHLIIHAKRFEFDLELFKRVKLNDYFEFPHFLNMEPYTKEGLEKKEKGVQPHPPIHPPTYYEYQLAGILVHTGTADTGHYYSFIRVIPLSSVIISAQERNPPPGQEPRWFQFNDTDVDLYDPQVK